MIRRFLRQNYVPLLDQGLSSATNLIAVLAVARATGSADFGVFALSYTALVIALGVSRAFLGTPMVLAAAGPENGLAKLLSSSVSVLVILAIPIVMVVGVIGAVAFFANPSGLALLTVIIVSLATPVILTHDIYRYHAIAKNQAGTALISDAVWFVGAATLFTLANLMNPEWILIGWLLIILAALALFIVRHPLRFDLRGGLKLLAPQVGLKESLAISALLSTGVVLVMGFLMLPFLGSAAVGALRGAGTLFGPINTLVALLDFSVLAQLSRKARSSDLRLITIATVTLCAISAVWGVVLILLPESLGFLLLGETWRGTRDILPITAIEYVLGCVTAGTAVLLKLRDKGPSLLLNRAVASVAILSVTVVALLLGGGIEWMALALLAGAAVSAAGMIYSARIIYRADRD